MAFIFRVQCHQSVLLLLLLLDMCGCMLPWYSV
jgi:hypothetical protein